MNGGETTLSADSPRKRLAIIGGGSSGLISLKYALDRLSAWEIVCFERTDRITGVWGNPYPGFVSTSTKYTTQFACYPLYDAVMQPDGAAQRSEFFRDGEYGAYLEKFADTFSLRNHILLRCSVESVHPDPDGKGWTLTVEDLGGDRPQRREEHFDAVILCTGIAAEPKRIESDIPVLQAAELNCQSSLNKIRNKRIVIVGGGESAVDHANRLAAPSLQNEVYLSLRSGIRVSPRYHPIRGVPSDFLRNRLLLSIDPDIRNWVGQRFVEARIQYEEGFRRLFPGRKSTESSANEAVDIATRRREWALVLTKAAKDELFNMFHNKSDDFLDAVAERRITIVGPPRDGGHRRFQQFADEGEVELNPDLLVPATGYRPRFPELSQGAIQLTDFYLGCWHTKHPNLFLVGFARPIIGNIPSISEMQARYVVGTIAGDLRRPADIERLHAGDLAERRSRYPKLDLDTVFPVEMFPYCDRLARQMDIYPSPRRVGSLWRWVRMQLAPATTIHYQQASLGNAARPRVEPIYMPFILALLLLMLKPIDFLYRLFRRMRRCAPSSGRITTIGTR